MSFNINDVPNNANTYLPVAPVIPGMLLITDISRSYPMIVSFTNSDENTYIEDQVVVLTVPRPYGMFQANGNQGKILRVVGTNLLLDIDSRQYDQFVVPSGVTVAQPASLAPGGSRNLQFSNLTNIEPFQSITGVITSIMALQFNKVVFPTAGTYSYVPTSGMTTCIIEVVGSGAGGGACIGNVGSIAIGAGGGGGGYSVGTFSASEIGSSQTVIVGSGGVSASNGNTSSVGSLITALGGSLGIGTGAGSFGLVAGGNGAGAGTGGDFNIQGQDGGPGQAFVSPTYPNSYVISGFGGSSFYGFGGSAIATNIDGVYNGSNGKNYGSGGSGGAVINTSSTATGGSGASGIVIITEFIV